MAFEFLIFLQSNSSDATGVGCCGVIVLVILIAVLIGNSTNKQRAQALNKVWTDYQDSLTYLKAHSTDPEVRQGTLEYGRRYSNLTRNKKGVTIFDEVALMNDINAACGGVTAITATAEAITETKSRSQSETIETRLQKLTTLRNNGLINEQEFASRRQRILDEI